VLHLAAQVAVTTSLADPLADFEINACGTLNLLEAVRRHAPDAPVIFASTNKVYGRLLAQDQVRRDGDRYAPLPDVFARGVAENAPLDFYSPYGCSKGAADQYVRDYARVLGLRTVVLRMSCIYGPRQFGTEDLRLFTRDVAQSGETQALPTDLRRASRKRRALLSTLDQPAC
jgi:CDP-paratose 2-epimerase